MKKQHIFLSNFFQSIWVKPMNTSAVNYTLENYGGNEKFALVTAEETRSDVYKLPRNWMCVFDAKKGGCFLSCFSLHFSVCILKPGQYHADGLVQERCNSSALAMELRLFCSKLETHIDG